MLKDQTKLVLIKIVHTVIWAVFVFFIFYIVWSGVTSRISSFSWIAVSLVVVEGIVLLIFGGNCPLTVMARKYSDSPKANFDIFLPDWLAKYNKQIFTSLFGIGLLLMLAQYLFHR